MARLTVSPQTKRLLDLVSSRTGIVRELVRVSRGVDEPSPPILYQAMLSNFDFKKATPLEPAGAGKGLTDEEAISGAIGEAIEHYCAYHIEPARLRRIPRGSVTSNYLAPEECVLYSDRQYARPDFPYLRPFAAMEIDWVAGRELPDDNDILLPAPLVYLHANNVMPGESLCPPTSNGLAAGPTLCAAIRRGLCELIERDAFLITWMNKLAMPEVDFSAMPGPASAMADHYRRFGLDTRVFNITTDIPVSVMMAVSLDFSAQTPAAVVGLGCHLNP